MNSQEKKQTVISSKAFFFPLLVSTLFFIVAMFLLLPVVSLSGQTFQDLIFATTSGFGLCKSGEIVLFWLLLPIALAMGIFLMQRYPNQIHDSEKMQSGLEDKVYWNIPVLIKIIFLLVFLYYGTTGIISLLILKGFSLPKGFLPYLFLASIGTSCLLIILELKIKKQFLTPVFTVLQFLIPLNLLVFLKTSYSYRGEEIILGLPPGYYICIIGLIVMCYIMFFLENYFLCKKKGIEANAINFCNNPILISSILAIAVFNAYCMPIRVVPDDLWHHGEEVVAWQQVFECGKTLYHDYMPASGLHPFVEGFYLNVILDKTAASIPEACALLMITIAILTIFLCYTVTRSRAITLFIAIYYNIPVYHRYYFLLPSLLILATPSLIRKRSSWLRLWVLFCFLNGLYYPNCGGALALGGLPFALIQIYFWIKNGDAHKEIRTLIFWFWWIVCLLPIILSIPLLLRMAKYVLSAASQTILADGIPLYASYTDLLHQLINDSNIWFICWELGKAGCHLIHRYTLPMLGIFIPVLCLSAYFRSTSRSTTEKLQSPIFFGLSSVPLTLCALYSYTFVRADVNCMMSRTLYVLVTVISVFFFLIIWKYGNDFLTRPVRITILLICISWGIYLPAFQNYKGGVNMPLSTIGTGGFLYDKTKLSPRYEIPDSYFYYESGIPDTRIGKGFVPDSIHSTFLQFRDQLKKYDFQQYDIVNLPRLFYHIFNLKCFYTEASQLVKSEQMQREMLKKAESAPPAFFYGITPDEYLLYRWILRNGYKKVEENLYVSPKLLSGNRSLKEAPKRDIKLNFQTNNNFSYHSFGRSFKTLEPLFEKGTDITSNIEIADNFEIKKLNIYRPVSFPCSFRLKLPHDLDSKEYDFLYIKFKFELQEPQSFLKRYVSRLKAEFSGYYQQLSLTWKMSQETKSPNILQTRIFLDGVFLFPLGFNADWLSEPHSELILTFDDTTPILKGLEIEKILLLKKKLFDERALK